MPLKADENRSEVARLMRSITEEYEAAQRGLYGLASGVAKHAFIDAKMHTIEQAHIQLIMLIGEGEAGQALVQAIEKANIEPAYVSCMPGEQGEVYE